MEPSSDTNTNASQTIKPQSSRVAGKLNKGYDYGEAQVAYGGVMKPGS